MQVQSAPYFLSLVLICRSFHGLVAVETSVPETDSSVVVRSTIGSTKMLEVDQWGLTSTEWQRYEFLMQGIRKHLSTDSISPVEVLGIHARNDMERSKYARMWAQLMVEDASRILAFQRAYDEEIAKLVANLPIIDEDVIARREKQQFTLQSDDRIGFVTALGCPVCDITFARVIEQLEKVAAVDIYFTNIEAAEQFRAIAWLRAFDIDDHFYRAQRVTLNFGLPSHFSTSDESRAPALFVVRNGITSRIPSYVFP